MSLNTSAVSTGDTPTGFLAWAVVRLTPGGSPGFIQPKLLDLEPTPGASPGLIKTERRLMLLTLPTMLDPRRAPQPTHLHTDRQQPRRRDHPATVLEPVAYEERERVHRAEAGDS